MDSTLIHLYTIKFMISLLKVVSLVLILTRIWVYSTTTQFFLSYHLQMSLLSASLMFLMIGFNILKLDVQLIFYGSSC